MKEFIITITWKDGSRVQANVRSFNILKAISETVLHWDITLDEDIKDILKISAVIEKEA